MATETESESETEAVDLLIIGAGAAGISALRSYREHDGEGRVVILSDDPDAPYERPPLSKDYLRGQIEDDDTRLLEPGGPGPLGELSELEQLGAEIRRARATGIYPEQRLVKDSEGGRFSYRWCLLATGSHPVRLPVPGATHPRVLQLRTLDDARELRTAAGSTATTAAVIGSGFIGCEAAVSLARLGLDVTLITDEDAPQQRRLGAAASERITGWLEDEKVRLRTGSPISSIDVEDGPGGRVTVRTESGGEVEADVVLMAVGIAPGSDLAGSAGLKLDNDRIVTDAQMRTSADGVLAAGDVVTAFNTSAGRALAVEHWGEALRMGEIAGATAAGDDDEWSNAPGFWSQIGDRQLKYAAWGDGFEDAHLRVYGGGGFTVWYTDAAGVTVGVLTYDRDEDYERGQELVESAAPPPLG